MPKAPPGMHKCERCGWIYPLTYMNVFRTNLPDIGSPVICGICALALYNQIHGTNRQKFDGEAAEYMRQAVIEWRKKHPYDDPEKRKIN